ncbi:hypothetical protein G7047_06920 [Diaphorobacter sp. HDW4A]|uniref:hypothetical protein n=1 Tax=Diaphorobacter sp. HDW4A TaxID=2714924 RepID=UPI0014081823|nr:hypothetical protein [Diaphorobacter sp. HDW4A]QIL78470.1 hypothetical protein G7047_06920 [Diaphorobacter sp. HDW4A]
MRSRLAVRHNQIELINQSLLVLAGSKAGSGYMASDAFAKATRATHTDLLKIECTSHVGTNREPRCGGAPMTTPGRFSRPAEVEGALCIFM